MEFCKIDPCDDIDDDDIDDDDGEKTVATDPAAVDIKRLLSIGEEGRMRGGSGENCSVRKIGTDSESSSFIFLNGELTHESRSKP
jgi:hypothetical protein